MDRIDTIMIDTMMDTKIDAKIETIIRTNTITEAAPTKFDEVRRVLSKRNQHNYNAMLMAGHPDVH